MRLLRPLPSCLKNPDTVLEISDPDFLCFYTVSHSRLFWVFFTIRHDTSERPPLTNFSLHHWDGRRMWWYGCAMGQHGLTPSLFSRIMVCLEVNVCCHTEARWMCRAMRCKYIQVSAALNHHVDDLLAGLVHQIRLNPDRQSADTDQLDTTTGSRSPTCSTPRCFSAAKDRFLRWIGKKSSSSFDCDNLWTL